RPPGGPLRGRARAGESLAGLGRRGWHHLYGGGAGAGDRLAVAGRGLREATHRRLRPASVLRLDRVSAAPLDHGDRQQALTQAVGMTLSVHDLPAVNATLNAISGVLLVVGYALMRARRIDDHRKAMIAAFATSSLFLVSYVVYHAQVGSVRFTRQG